VYWLFGSQAFTGSLQSTTLRETSALSGPPGPSRAAVTNANGRAKARLLHILVFTPGLRGREHFWRLRLGQSSTVLTELLAAKYAALHVDAILDDRYASGVFYGNEAKTIRPLTDQVSFFPDLRNVAFQDNARAAILRFTN